MGEIGGGNPGEENDSYGVAVKCQACTMSCYFIASS